MRNRLTYAAMGLVVAGTLAACGGGDADSPGSSAPDQGDSAGGSAGSAESGTTVSVSETDFALELSTTTFSPGEYTFEITNDGDTTHALEVDGPGVSDLESDEIGPGESTSMTLTLEAGEYEIYCPVANHADMGMTTTITVG